MYGNIMGDLPNSSNNKDHEMDMLPTDELAILIDKNSTLL